MRNQKKILIEARILSDPDFRVKCLMLLYDKQLEMEQQSGTSMVKNEVGFAASDAMYLSTIAQLRRINPNYSCDSFLLQKYLPKYSTQLCNYLTEDEILN
jgi:hypothetical protein